MKKIINTIKAKTYNWDWVIILEVAIAVIVLGAVITVCVIFYNGECGDSTNYATTFMNYQTTYRNINNILH